MALPELEIDDPEDDVLDEHVHCLTTTQANPHAASEAPRFQLLIDDWKEVSVIRVGLLIAVSQTRATALFVDTLLNGIVDEVVAALKVVTRNEKKDPLWTVFFKGKEPSVFKRPILGGQLAAMSLWTTALADSGHTELKAIGIKLAPILVDAKNAEVAVAVAKQNLVEFKNIGRWRQHIDKSNAERASAYGKLLEVPFQNPNAKLKPDFADLFFLHDTRRRVKNKPTAADIAVDIKDLTEKLEVLKEQHEAALEREAADAELRAKREAQAKELADLKKQEEENKKRQKEIEDDLNKK